MYPGAKKKDSNNSCAHACADMFYSQYANEKYLKMLRREQLEVQKNLKSAKMLKIRITVDD